jgi:2Fe-2S ferredoxin
MNPLPPVGAVAASELDMAKVNFVGADGVERQVAIAAGVSIMEGGVHGGIEGIVAECGGSLVCATCHVYLDAAFADAFAPVSPLEDALLDGVASERTERSRLSCQLVVTEAMEEIRVRLPETQV